MSAPNAEQVHAILAATYLGDPAARGEAERTLKELENVPTFPSILLHLLAEPTVEDPVKQAAAIYLKNKVTRCWKDDATNPIAQGDKEVLRTHILSVLGKCSRGTTVQLTACLGTMLSNDYPEKWPGYMNSVQELLSAPTAEGVRIGLLALKEVVGVYQWKTDNKRAPLTQIVKATFPQLEKIGSGLLGVDSKEAHEMLKLVVKIYYRSIQADLSKIQQDKTWLVSWGNLLIKTILLQPPASAMPEDLDEREKASFWKAKKWSYRTLNRLFSRYGNPTIDSNKAKFGAFAKLFVENFAPLILKTYLSQVEQLVTGQAWLSKRAMHSISTFLGDCVKLKQTWKLMKPNVPSIVGYFIFPMVCFSNEDAEVWEEDPVEYVRKKIDPMEDFKSPQSAASTLLTTLVRDRSQTLPQVLEVVSAAVQRYIDAPSEENARRKDGAINMVGIILDPLMENESIKQHFKIEDFALNHVLPELQSPYPFLRDRALELFVKLCEYEFQNKEGLMAIARGVLGCLRDPNLPVRVTAALVIPQVLVHEEVRTAMAPDAPLIMNELLKLTNEIDMDTLTSAMETLVEVFSEQLTPFAVELCTSLRASFMRIVEGIKNTEDEEDESWYTEGNDKTMAAMGILKTIATLVYSVEGSKDVLAQLETIVAPMVAYVLQNSFVDHYEDIFEIVDTFTYCTKSISPTTWQIFELVYQGIKDGMIDFIEEPLPLLDNIVTYGSATLFATEQYKQMMLDVVRLIMTGNQFADTDRISGCQLMESLMLSGKGQLDDTIPVFVGYATHYLNDEEAKSDAYLVHLLETVINAFVYNPALSLHVLEQQSQTGPFFTKWLQSLDKFTRVHDIRLSVLGLCAVLTCPSDHIPQVVQAGWPQLGVAFSKLFEELPDALATREELRKEHENESDDEDNDKAQSEGDEEEVEEFDDGNASDGDVRSEGDEYLDYLASRGAKVEGGEDDDSDEDDDGDWDAELEEDIYFETILDTVDPYKTFATVLLDLSHREQGMYQSLTSSLSPEQSRVLQEAITKGTSAT